MAVLRPSAPVTGPDYAANREAMLRLTGLARAAVTAAAEGGSPTARRRHADQGKLLPRARIAALLDPGAPFLEIGALAAHGLYDGAAPGAGIIAGVGRVSGRICMILCNDATVHGGIYYPMTVKLHLRAQEIAAENRLPCIYLVDSSGTSLSLQDEVFPDRDHFGRIFRNQARMSVAGIPQIAVVMGPCTAGGAFVPAMSDETVIVRNQGSITLGEPALVRAATGEEVTAEALGGGELHARMSGLADHLAGNDTQALAIARRIVAGLGPAPASDIACLAPEAPLHDPGELPGLVPVDWRAPYDVQEVLARVLDGSRFDAFKARYGTALATGFGHIHGIPCGVVANNGLIDADAAQKAAQFIDLCCQRRTPLVFLQNVAGFRIDPRAEAGGITKHGARMLHAVAVAEVPKITMIIGGAFGAGSYGMCGRACEPRFLWSWPNARIAVMGGQQAAGVLSSDRREAVERAGGRFTDADDKALRAPVEEQFERQSDALYASARLWDDGIVDPRSTRDVLGLSLAATLCAPVGETRLGVARM